MVLRKTNYRIISFCLLILSLAFITGCEEEVDGNNPNNPENTLGENNIGNGSEGYISDYFYNFNHQIQAEYFRIDQNNFDLNHSEYLSLYSYEPSVLTLKTFPEYLIEIQPADLYYTVRSLIDSLTIDNVVIEDSVTLFSDQYRDLESMEWDLTAEPEFQRYTSNSSNQFEFDTTIVYSDTIQTLAYSAVVDTPLINEGLMFVDAAEWTDTTYNYTSAIPLTFTNTFQVKQWRLSSDSLMFRLNTDCNDNGEWDVAESTSDDSTATFNLYDPTVEKWFADTGNGVWDPAEPWYDIDDDGDYDLNEPYQDRNCDGIWNAAEDTSDASDPAAIYDPGADKWFIDRGNGKYDGDEYYTDLDGDDAGDPGELFYLDIIPNNLLVDWADPDDPVVLLEIEQNDSLVTRWGITYHDLIEEVTLDDRQAATVSLLDSTVTLYTNQIVGHVTGNGVDDDYLVTKTEWTNLNPAIGEDPREYDYLLFKQNDYVYQLIRPSYFKPYGYYWTESQLEKNFWYENFIKDEILYYTPNGYLRDGERVTEEYVDTTKIAIYKMEKSFAVDADTVTVPAKHVRGSLVNGTVRCVADTNWTAATVDDCPGADTTFTDCFRITRELTMTMIGTGLEYGERNITWLARDHGIVMDEVLIRWSETFDIEETWVGLSRWELGRLEKGPAVSSSALTRLMDQARSIRLEEFDQVPEFDNDPIHWKRTIGLQRASSTNH